MTSGIVGPDGQPVSGPEQQIGVPVAPIKLRNPHNPDEIIEVPVPLVAVAAIQQEVFVALADVVAMRVVQMIGPKQKGVKRPKIN